MTPTPDTTPAAVEAMIERLTTAAEDDHERGCQMRFCSCSCGFDDKSAKAASEAAAMLRAVASERDEANRAMKRQAAAVRTLHACEATEINRLREKTRVEHVAVATLDSEKEANARLTDALLAAEAEAAALREALKDAADLIDGYVEFLRRMPSRYLEEHPYIPTVEDVLGRCHAALKENHDDSTHR